MKLMKWKHFFIALIYLVVTIGIMIGVSYYQYKDYNIIYNKKLNQMCILLEDKYPKLKGYEVMELMNETEDVQTENFFEKYGINLKKDVIIKKNDALFGKHVLIKFKLFVILSLPMALVFVIYRIRYLRKIKDITQCIRRINDGDYSFDMDNLSEGNLSFLENELYKTTIMLKESADNSRKDKENLKNSLSDISHQLKTPLTSLSINLENLEYFDFNISDVADNGSDRIMGNSATDELSGTGLDIQTEFNSQLETQIASHKRLVSMAKRDVNKIRTMVQKLLVLSRFDANVITFSKDKISMNKLIVESIEPLEPLADLLGIELQYQNDADSSPILECDFYWQKEAIGNIVKNSIEHACTQVQISYYNNKLYKEIIVENDGEWIDKDDISNIFKRFYKGKNSTTNSVGIGLALAETIVKREGGYILVENTGSQKKPGVRFTIRYS